MDKQPEITQELPPQVSDQEVKPEVPLQPSGQGQQLPQDQQQQEVQPQEAQPEQAPLAPEQKPEDPTKKLLSPEELQVAFKKYDKDEDNKITVQEALALLNQFGVSIYEGSVYRAARMIHFKEYNKNEEYEFFTFQEFKLFYYRLDNTLKREIWEGAMKIKDEVEEARKTMFPDLQEANEVAPKIKEEELKSGGKFEGDLEVIVGDQNGTYNSFVEAHVIKRKREESKPYLRLVLHQSSHEKAVQLQDKLKSLHKFLCDLGISKDPEYSEFTQKIHFETSVSDNKIIINITTSSVEILEFIEIGCSFFDELFKAKPEAEARAKIEFNIDIKKFLQKDSKYTYYDVVCKNYRIKLQWDSFNLKKISRQLYDNMVSDFKKKSDEDPLYDVVVFLMNTRKCHASLSFDNIEIGQYQLQTKKYILENLLKLQERVLQKYEIGKLLEQTLRSFENIVDFEASAGDWFADGKLNIRDLNMLFNFDVISELFKKEQNQDSD